MNTQLCKVGTIRTHLDRFLNLKDLERKYLNFMEEAYNLMQSDSGLSDALYYEAAKIKKLMLSIKHSKQFGAIA